MRSGKAGIRCMTDSATCNPAERRGGYRPKPEPPKHPIFQWPIKHAEILRYFFGFPGYFWPHATFFAGVALAWWALLTPPINEMKELLPGWVGLLFLSNLALLVLFVGSLHLRLYVHRAQGTDYKYNSNWLSKNNRTF